MRAYQPYGLTGEAVIWIEKNCQTESGLICPHCGFAVTTVPKIILEEQADVFYGDGPVLHTYLTKSGAMVKEVIQAQPWSSGPCVFLCLEMEDGERIGEWDEDIIEHI